MAFYNGEEFIIQRVDVCRKNPAGFCEETACGKPIMKDDAVAVCAWGPGDKWCLMHPDCAENSPRNLDNKKQKDKSEVQNLDDSFEDAKNRYMRGTGSELVSAVKRGEVHGVFYNKMAGIDVRFAWLKAKDK